MMSAGQIDSDRNNKTKTKTNRNSSNSNSGNINTAKTNSLEFKKKYKTFKTLEIPYPTYYVKALLGEFNEWALTEEQALKFKGLWKSHFFKNLKKPLDLEIGTGNGFHFAHYAQSNPDRQILGLELKYKPLIQTIRRALENGSKNARIARFNASRLDYLFEAQEINNVIIHHPDPWLKKSQKKNRLIQREFLENLHQIQKKNSIVDFKTDNLDYFEWAIERFKDSSYHIIRETFDLHNSEWKAENYITAFERIFLSKGQKIYYCRLKK